MTRDQALDLEQLRDALDALGANPRERAAAIGGGVSPDTVASWYSGRRRPCCEFCREHVLGLARDRQAALEAASSPESDPSEVPEGKRRHAFRIAETAFAALGMDDPGMYPDLYLGDWKRRSIYCRADERTIRRIADDLDQRSHPATRGDWDQPAYWATACKRALVSLREQLPTVFPKKEVNR